MNPGDLIDLDITGAAHGGEFVGRHEGRVVFIGDAIPGERVRVRLTQAGEKSFWRGETVSVLDASPHRRAHVWRPADIDTPPQDRPGGADYGHIELGHQRTLKRQVLIDALGRMGGIDLPTDVEAVPGDDEHDGLRWRTRVSLHVDDDGRVGPYAARSHRVVPVEELPLATAAIERAAAGLRDVAPGRVDLVHPSGDGRVRVLPRPQRSLRAGRRRVARQSADTVLERVGERVFRLDAGGFWQVHRRAAATLSAVVADTLRTLGDDGPLHDPDATHLDLYGGVGLFATVIAEQAASSARVISVEADTRATDHAGENLAEWVGARAETGRVDRWLPRLRATASARELARLHRGVVVLDPPRSGAGAAVVRTLCEVAPAAVVYVACDPVALARDLATFRDGGYRTVSVRGLDLFPHSHHVEAVALLLPADRAR